METVRAYAPATIANFNVGYDLLGVSLNNIGDEVHLTFNGRQNNAIIEIVNGDGLPLDVKKNCCSVVIAKMQEKLNVHISFSCVPYYCIELDKVAKSLIKLVALNCLHLVLKWKWRQKIM